MKTKQINVLCAPIDKIKSSPDDLNPKEGVNLKNNPEEIKNFKEKLGIIYKEMKEKIKEEIKEEIK